MITVILLIIMAALLIKLSLDDWRKAWVSDKYLIPLMITGIITGFLTGEWSQVITNALIAGGFGLLMQLIKAWGSADTMIIISLAVLFPAYSVLFTLLFVAVSMSYSFIIGRVKRVWSYNINESSIPFIPSFLILFIVYVGLVIGFKGL